VIGDLHIHSHYSDGSSSIPEIMSEATRRGLRFVSIVDHDTAAGTPEARAEGLRRGVAVIPGVEVSAFDFDRGRKVHILGYGYSTDDPIEELCARTLEARNAMTIRQIEALEACGYPVDLESVRAIAEGFGVRGPECRRPDPPILYKQHIMVCLMRAGLCNDVYAPLYRELFKGDGPAAGEIAYVDAREAVSAVVESGGYPVLAHPGQLDSYDIIPDLVDAGLAGIELYHGDHGPGDYRRIREAAKRFGLFVTGGSDNHGVLGSEHDIGDIRAPFGAHSQFLTVN
jgi:phosphoribosyl 1,2-cyclic phosphate 1,2-diphosphodiesterase